jgi:hypothetical protein
VGKKRRAKVARPIPEPTFLDQLSGVMDEALGEIKTRVVGSLRQAIHTKTMPNFEEVLKEPLVQNGVPEFKPDDNIKDAEVISVRTEKP